MDIRYSEETEAYRQEVRAFLADHVPADWAGIGSLEGEVYAEFIATWRAKLHEHGLLAPAWPREYGGGGLSQLEQIVLAEEFARAGVPTGTPNDEYGIEMLGNTLLVHGTEEQKRHFLPRILSGELVFCQGFSEPNAGSDLANLNCKAALDGGRWVINGQKIWTSHALNANWIFVLARTNPQAPRHAGISMILVPIEQEGVELRPIRMLTGDAEFCETFFTDAVAERDHVIGAVDGGWAVAMDLLGHERGQQAVVLPLRFRADLDRLLELARERGAADDPLIRQRLAWCYERVSIMRCLGWRELTRWLDGEPPGSEASIFKLHWSEYQQEETRLALEILGEDGLIATGRRPHDPYTVDDVGAPNSTASWQGALLSAMGGTIYAGTSEIQRSVIGERVLGLPREPRPQPELPRKS